MRARTPARDYGPTGPQLRRALWRKQAALDRAQRARVLCDPHLPPDQQQSIRRVWQRLLLQITPRHIRTADDCC